MRILLNLGLREVAIFSPRRGRERHPTPALLVCMYYYC